MTDLATLTYERGERVARITLNRPERGNGIVPRITEEGHDFVRRSMEGGFKQAVRERDEPFGDYGLGGSGVR